MIAGDFPCISYKTGHMALSVGVHRTTLTEKRVVICICICIRVKWIFSQTQTLKETFSFSMHFAPDGLTLLKDKDKEKARQMDSFRRTLTCIHMNRSRKLIWSSLSYYPSSALPGPNTALKVAGRCRAKWVFTFFLAHSTQKTDFFLLLFPLSNILSTNSTYCTLVRVRVRKQKKKARERERLSSRGENFSKEWAWGGRVKRIPHLNILDPIARKVSCKSICDCNTSRQ